MSNISDKQYRDLTSAAQAAAYAIVQEKLPGARLNSGMSTVYYPISVEYDNAFIIQFSFDENDAPQIKDGLNKITIGDSTIWQGAYQILALQIDYMANGQYEYARGRLVSGARIEYEYDAERNEPEIIINASRARAREIQQLTKLITFLKTGNVNYVLNRERHSEKLKKAIVKEYKKGGVTQATIAEDYKISERTLRRWADKYG